MLRRQPDHYGQKKIIHTEGSNQNLLSIINRMILIQKKEVNDTAFTSGKSFTKPNLE